MGTPMEGFFGGAKFATLAASANTHGVPVKTSTSPTEPVPIDESTHTGEVSEVTHPLTETPSVQRGATPPATTQIETTSVTPLVISTGDPFAALSQAMKDGSSLVVTPSSIPISATRGPDVDLSSEEFENIPEDLDDEPVLGRRISESEEEEGASPKTFTGILFFFLLFSFFFLSFFFAKFTLPLLFACPFLLFAEPSKRLGIAACVGVSATATSAAPIAPIPAISFVPVSAVFIAFVSTIPSVPVSVLPTTPIVTALGELFFSLFLHFFPVGLSPPFFLPRFLISCLVLS